MGEKNPLDRILRKEIEIMPPSFGLPSRPVLGFFVCFGPTKITVS